MGIICCHLNVAVRRVSRVLFRRLVHFPIAVPNYGVSGQMMLGGGGGVTMREKKIGEQLILLNMHNRIRLFVNSSPSTVYLL
jgi:hypothetical protein